MKTLIIDTTSRNSYCILDVDGKMVDTASRFDVLSHSSTLSVDVDELLKRNHLEYADLDCYAVNVGVGSFTGIRIGIATVKGMNFALPRPLISVNTLQLLAYTTNGAVDCLMDAGRELFYHAKYDGFTQLTAPELIDKTQAEILMNSSKTVVFDQKVDLTASLLALVNDKITHGDFSEKLTPIYLRKPQAQEEYECKRQ